MMLIYKTLFRATSKQGMCWDYMHKVTCLGLVKQKLMQGISNRICPQDTVVGPELPLHLVLALSTYVVTSVLRLVNSICMAVYI